MCPGVNKSLMSAAAQAALQENAAAVASLPTKGVLEASDAAIGAGDKDVRLALQGAREKIVFQMDSSGAAEAGVAVGQTHAGRKDRANRQLSAGVWADADEADIFKVCAHAHVTHPLTYVCLLRERVCAARLIFLFVANCCVILAEGKRGGC